MDYEQSSNCWYKEVCDKQSDRCENTCIRYAEMLYLVENSGIPKKETIPL